MRSRGVDRLISSQLALMNSGLAKQKTLKELVSEEKPLSVTGNNDAYYFDEEELDEIAGILPTYQHSDLRLPIYLHVDLEVQDQCYVDDGIQAEVVKRIGGLGEGYRLRRDKLWIPKTIARMIKRKHPTTVQYLWLP